jgi:hypothetical protein
MLHNYCAKKRTGVGQVAKDSTPKPSDYEVGSLRSRAAARAVLDANVQRIQLIFSCEDEPLNLQTSTCERTLWPNALVEMVFLDGRASDLTDQQLDEFTRRFPIKDDCERNSGGQSQG